MILFRMSIMYSRQSWFQEFSFFRFIKRYENSSVLGPCECEWQNIKTGELVKIFDIIMIPIPEPESISILRNIKIDYLL